MSEKKTIRFLSVFLSVILLLSGVAVPSFAAKSYEDIIQAAKEYVRTNKNNSDCDGLLAAVRAVNSDVTLDEKNDFFIKHAVDGVCDNDDTYGYGLNISGSNGAVAAIFEINGRRIGFTEGFENETEVIDISKVAIVGESEGFEYDSSGNVIRYEGNADKMIFPKGYYGTMTELSDKSSVNNIKVVIIDTDDPNNDYNTCVRLSINAFRNWNGLKAVQFEENAHARLLFNNMVEPYKTTYDTNIPYIFADCSNLKYVKLPKILYGAKYILPTGIFENCKALENIVFHQGGDSLPIATRAFAYTNVWDFFLNTYVGDATDQYNVFYGGRCRADEMGQVITYNTPMTFCRAAALAAAVATGIDGIKELTSEGAKEEIENAIVGSSDASAFSSSLSYDWNGTWTESAFYNGGTLSITAPNGDSVAIEVKNSFWKTDSEIENMIIGIAKEYVLSNKNNVTAQGLLTAVQNTVPSVNLNTDKDFFIKHSTPSVTDNDTASGYRLDIKGSDGAVSAIFELNGKRIGFAYAFPNDEELIDIQEVAIVGQSGGFTYDQNNNVTSYNGNADKIVFPKGYYGTMTELSDKTSVNRVKVVIIDTDSYGQGYEICVRMKEKAFSEWQNLVAVQFGENAHSRLLFDNVNEPYKTTYKTSVPDIFADCPKLKYVKMPAYIVGANYSIPSGMFKNCVGLENVVLPQMSDVLPIADNAFLNTAISDMFLPEWIDESGNISAAFNGSKCLTEMGQTVFYTENMSLCRAAALAAVGFVQTDTKDSDTACLEMLSEIIGTHDADVFCSKISVDWNDTWVVSDEYCGGVLEVSDGNDTVSVIVEKTFDNAFLGDAQGDNIVDLLDLIRMKKHLAGNSMLDKIDRADINTDGNVDTADMVLLKQFLLGTYALPCSPQIYLNYKDGLLNTVQKYSNTSDLAVTFGMIDGIGYGISSVFEVHNKNTTVSAPWGQTNSVSKEPMGFGGRYLVYAVNDTDGGFSDEKTYTGSVNGTVDDAVGRVGNIKVYVDGKEVTEYKGHAHKLTVTWDVYVKASNTVKSDSYGREVLIEHNSLTFDGETYYVETDVEPLEDVIIEDYIGMSMAAIEGFGRWLRFGDKAWTISATDSVADSKYCNSIILNKDCNYIEMYIDNSYGVGDRSYLSDDSSGAMYLPVSENGRTGFSLVGQSTAFAGGEALSHRGYLRFYSSDSDSIKSPEGSYLAGNVQGVSNVLLTYVCNGTTPVYHKESTFLPSVAYMENGAIKDTLFDTFLFLPQPNFIYDYGTDDDGRAPLTMTDFERYYGYQFAATNMGALNSATGKMKQALGVDDYKTKVIMTVAYPVKSVTNFGTVDGSQLDLSDNEDRKNAVKWMIDRQIELFNANQYEHLEIAGFYWFGESINMTDDNQTIEVIRYMNEYLSSLSLAGTWLPYYHANGYGSGRALGFDIIAMQPNFFPAADLPNAGGEERLALTAKDALEYDLGVMIELQSVSEESVTHLKKYYLSGITTGYIDAFHAFYMQYGPRAFSELYNSTDSYIRSAYDDTYKFIKKVLKTSDINLN